MVSGQIIPTERNLVCISCCGNRHYAHCSCNNGMASPQKYLITCSKEEKFSVPKNIYIIGMMNTADRSLAMLDYAFRISFAFFEIKLGFETLGFREYRMALDNEKFNLEYRIQRNIKQEQVLKK